MSYATANALLQILTPAADNPARVLVVANSAREAEYLQSKLRHLPHVVCRSYAMMIGMRAEVVVVLPLEESATAAERERHEQALLESARCRVAPGGVYVRL